MMKKIKILYVYGYGDSPDSEYVERIKKELDSKKYSIISDYYAQYSPKEALYDLNEIIKKEKINLVIGENLGGYLVTLLDKDLPKIIIDPIYNPVIELAEYKTVNIDDKGNKVEMPFVPKHIIKFYKENENLERHFDNVYAIFSNNDNFNEYFNLCSTIKSDNIIGTIINIIKEC